MQPRFLMLITSDDGPDEEIYVDGTMREVHQLSSLVTQFPVGAGRSTTDHVQAQPTVFSVDLLITETPTIPLIRELVTDFDLVESTVKAGAQEATISGPVNIPAPFERAIALYERLDAARLEGTLMTLTTAMGRLPRMVVTSLSAPVDSPQQSVLISVDFTQVTIAHSAETRTVARATPRLQSPTSTTASAAEREPREFTRGALEALAAPFLG